MNTTTDALIEQAAERLLAPPAGQAWPHASAPGELPAALWQRVQHSGFAHLLATEAAGGHSQAWPDAWALLHGLGHWQVPVPLAETLVASQLASLAGLPLPDGVLGLLEQGRCPGLRLGGSAAAPTLSGMAHHVAWARHAQAVLVALADGRVAWLALQGQAGVSVQPWLNHAGLPADTLVLDQAALGPPAALPMALAEPVWTLGALARSVMLVGAMSSALEMAVLHANQRQQFGKPIGAQQAVQQQLALAAGDLAAARVAVLAALADAPSAHRPDCPALPFSVAVAKVRAGEAASRCAAIAHQVHGAMGFTQEHRLHHASTRLWAWREEFGSDASWALQLGQAAISARAAGFWPGLTARGFG